MLRDRKMTHTSGTDCRIHPCMNRCDNETDEQEEKKNATHYQLLYHTHGTRYLTS